MTLSSEGLVAIVAALGSFVSILLGIYGAYRTGQQDDRTAKRTELVELRAQIVVLSDQMDHVLQDNIRLTRRVAVLETILIKHDIALPPDEMALKKT